MIEELILGKNELHPKFSDAIIEMIISDRLPYYGYFNQFVNFHSSKKVKTVANNVTAQGMNMYWNPDYMDTLLQKESNWILIYMTFKLMLNHNMRLKGYDKYISAVASDMIINQIIHDDIMKQSNGFVSIPQGHKEFFEDEFGKPIIIGDNNGKPEYMQNPMYNKNLTVYIPKIYKGDELVEGLYDFLVNEREKWRRTNKDQVNNLQNMMHHIDRQNHQNDPENVDPNATPAPAAPIENIENPLDNSHKDWYGKYGKNDTEMISLEKLFELMELEEQISLAEDVEDEVPQELRKNFIEDYLQKLKARGLQTNDVDMILNKLRKSKKDYLKEIKRKLASDVFGTVKNKSITKPNRRGIVGIKGKKKHKTSINCMLDTSGSMGGDFEKVLTYIFQNDIEINLIQCDTEIKKITKIKSMNDLQKMEIKGLGGTTLQPGLNYIADPKNKLHALNTVILTDGYTDSLDFREIKTYTLILSISEKCPIGHNNGKVKQIIIDKEQSMYS